MVIVTVACSLMLCLQPPSGFQETVGMPESFLTTSWLDGLEDFTEKLQTNEPIREPWDNIVEGAGIDKEANMPLLTRLKEVLSGLFDKIFNLLSKK